MSPLIEDRSLSQVLKTFQLCYIGDGNNMTNSLIVGGIKTGMEVAVACPNGYRPDLELIKWAEKNGKFTITENVLEAAKGADVLYTDVWE